MPSVVRFHIWNNIPWVVPEFWSLWSYALPSSQFGWGLSYAGHIIFMMQTAGYPVLLCNAYIYPDWFIFHSVLSVICIYHIKVLLMAKYQSCLCWSITYFLYNSTLIDMLKPTKNINIEQEYLYGMYIFIILNVGLRDFKL